MKQKEEEYLNVKGANLLIDPLLTNPLNSIAKLQF